MPLASIVERASVGVGTLYRHVPPREALIGATYANEIDQLGEVDALLRDQTGAVARPEPVEWLALTASPLPPRRYA